MANNYQQWSTEITDLTDEEMDWFEECFAWEPVEDVDLPDWYDVDTEGVGFEHRLDRKRRRVHVYAEESGNLGTLEELILEFIDKFRPNFVFTVQWADTCSAMRVDQFGGGAMVVSRLRTEYLDTYRWSQDRVDKMTMELEEKGSA